MSHAPLRWTLALATSVALVGLLSACSSTTESADAGSGSEVAAPSAGAPASAAPSSVATASAGGTASAVAPLDIPQDVIDGFLAASCVAPTESGGGGGEWDQGALACSTPDGTVMGPESAYLALADPGTRAYLVYTAYTFDQSATLSDCPPFEELDAATDGTPPAVSDACVSSTLVALTGALGG